MPRGRDLDQTGFLLPGEGVVLESRGRLRTTFPPSRSEGTLVLSSGRVLFIPDVYNELIGDVSMWLSELTEVNAAGRARLHIATREHGAVVELPGIRAMLTSAGARWALAIQDLMMSTRTAEAMAHDYRRAA